VVLTAVNPITDELTITNIGNAPIDVANFQLCTDGFRYDAINELRAADGAILDTDLAAGESLTMVWDEIGAVNGDDNATLILFSNSNFGSSNPDDLLDYVRWGTSNFRVTQGVAAGRWNSADATIECPSPYNTVNGRGGSPEGWGLVADGGTVAIDLDATGNPNSTTSFNGDTEAVICIDSRPDPIIVVHENPVSASNLSYRYVITDAATGLILNVIASNSIDLNGVAPGTCEIWGWSYRGVPNNGLDQIGEPLSALDDLDCSDISDNQITVIREAANGGTVAIDLDATGNPNSTTSFNGTNEAVICIDSRPDPIVVVHENPGAENLSYRYVITDAATGLILNVVNSSSIDYGIDQIGEPLSALDDLDCSDISDNQITVIREAANGGTVAIDTAATSDASGTTAINSDTSATITVGDDIANPIIVVHENAGSENLSYRYVITDAGNGIDQIGEPLSALDDLDCSDISDNQITVIREAVEVGVQIPAQNFIVRAIGESCEASNDGSIEITAQEEFNYTAAIDGVSLVNVNESFTTDLSFDNLEAGAYSICITVAEAPDFEQCFTLNVSEPQNLEVIEAFENSAKELNLQLSGGETYEINLNGELIFTEESEITLALSLGENNLTVKTDKDCQGVFSDKILVEGENSFNVVPNPVENTLNLIYTRSSNEKVSVVLYDISGRRVGTYTTIKDSQEASFDVSSLSAGIYFLNVEGTTNNVKILKK